MRILMTGVTAMQVGSQATKLKIATAIHAVKRALEEMGHEVDQRVVIPGEDLSRYDRAIITLHSLMKLGSSHTYGVLWALKQRPDALLTIDDWQVKDIEQSFDYYSRNPGALFRLDNRTYPAEAKQVVADLLKVIKDYAKGFGTHVTLVPAWEGGNLDLLGYPGVKVSFDPTPFTLLYETLTMPRRRVWVSASLINKQRFIPVDLRWPVMELGNKKLGQDRVEEQELQNFYDTCWGAFSLPHYHAGSGWWRVRYIMAARSGAIMCAHPDEARVMGPAYEEACDPYLVERLSSTALQHLAEDQQEDFAKKVWSKDQMTGCLSKVLNLGV